MAIRIIRKPFCILLCVLIWIGLDKTDARSPLVDEEAVFEETYSPTPIKPNPPNPLVGLPSTKLQGEITDKQPPKNDSKPIKGLGVGTVGGRFEPTNGTRLETVRGHNPARPTKGSGVATVGGHFEPTNADDLETVRGENASATVSYQVD